MALNRRTLLLGLVVLVVGAGIIGGTGAFASVQADRTMDLNTEGDSSALLELTNGSSVLTEQSGEGNTDVAVLQFNQDDLNANARTEFGPAFDIKNGGNSDIDELYIEEATFDSGDNDVELQEGGDIDFIVQSPGNTNANAGDSIVGSGNAVELGTNGGRVTVSVVVDTTGSITGDDLPTDGTVTIVANDTSAVAN